VPGSRVAGKSSKISARTEKFPGGWTFSERLRLRENFDRFNFAIHKEKEMNFRRWIAAMFVLALFAGLASAQIVIGPSTGTSAGPLACTATVTVPPALRAEGMTELIGDIVITCTGGSQLAAGATIPTANITVSLGTNVTSRILATSPVNATEALLLIDEPGSGLQGYGPTVPQTACSSAQAGAGLAGCQEIVSASYTFACPSALAGYCSGTAPNVFQGVWNSSYPNQIVFNGIPILPPVTGGFERVFRITNVRANIAGLGVTSPAGTQQLLASISISGSTSLTVNNPVQIAGFIQAGLSTSLRNTSNTGSLSVPNVNQCGGSTSPSSVAVLQYSENFATAFKTRVAPGTAVGSGQYALSTGQNVPGTIYNSESGFITPAVTSAGLADYGTRLTAVFNSVPTGVRIFVSTTNIQNTFANTQYPTTAPAPGIATTWSQGAQYFAELVLSGTAGDSNGFPPIQASTVQVNGSPYTYLAELPVVNGTATAVWEVITTNTAASETFTFGVWQQFTANPGAGSPPPGTATVNMSYAPTPTSGAFTASAGALASSSLTIPRFADTSTANNLFTIVICQTVLLFPFVTNQGGFDTGLAIANTSSDPFGTKVQAGGCNLYWYGANAPSMVPTGTVATGTVYATLASSAAPNFQGYMIAVCNFQLAHGFAFVSDVGAQKLAMGYLALILPGGTANTRPYNPGSTGIINETSWPH